MEQPTMGGNACMPDYERRLAAYYGVKFTPTEVRIMRVLSDGQLHSRKELHDCLVDDLGSLGNIKMHLVNIRKKIRPCGEDIVCVMPSRPAKLSYRHMMVLDSSRLQLSDRAMAIRLKALRLGAKPSFTGR